MSATPTSTHELDARDKESESAQQDPASDDVQTTTPEPQAAEAEKAAGRKVTGIRWVLVCLGLYATALMYGLDTTIAADIQAAVTEAFDEVSQIAWIGAGFPLGSVGVLLPYGALYANFNMKWLCIVGIALFQVGSAVCGAAPNMNALIVGRVLAGAGGTGMYLGTLNMFSAMTSSEERGTYISGIGFVWGLGAILGPLVGGGFSVSAATWRWGFYINLVVGAVTAPIYLLYLPDVHPAESKPTNDRLVSLDWVGFVLSAGIWVFFSMPLISAGGIWEWSDARTIAMLVVFGVLLLVYIVQQYFHPYITADQRSFPSHLLKSRTQILVFIGTSCSISTLFVVTYYIPIYFQFVLNDSALMAAVRLLPFLLVTIASNLASGWAIGKLKYYMAFYLVAGVMITIGGALLFVFLNPSTSVGAIYGFTVIAAVGTGITLQLGYTVAGISAAPDVVSAVNLQNVAQTGSSVVVLVIASQVFQSVAVRNLTSVLAGLGFSQDAIRDAVSGAQSTLFAALDDETRAAATLAVTGAIQRSFVLVIVAGALQTVAAAAMRVAPLPL